MLVSEFTYDLPEELIAIHPPKLRGSSRLLILDRKSGGIKHGQYNEFVDNVQAGDLVVLNDTKVIKARLLARNTKGQIRELLLLEDHHNNDFLSRKVLYRGKLSLGEILTVDSTDIEIVDIEDGGIAKISSHVNLLDLAEKAGSVPLPPYMHRNSTKEDVERYQTVFATNPGSVAAPTASLNFTNDLRDRLIAKGARIAYLTLHVGLGTFLPIRTDDITQHEMHSEYFEIPAETIQSIKTCKREQKRVIAVGTTVTRTLEYAHNDILNKQGVVTGEANIFIYPGYEFKMVDSLLTNFHAPKSTVLMMAAAFSGWKNLENAYHEAIKEKYAFLSYGDSMLII